MLMISSLIFVILLDGHFLKTVIAYHHAQSN
jgi:hypothetical protein